MAQANNARNKVISVDSGSPTPPVIQSAEVGNSADNIIVMTYDKALDISSTPATTDFTTSPSKTISSVVVLGSDVIITCDTDFLSTDTVTISYTQGTNPIQDLAGNPAANLTNYAVTNNISGGGFSPTSQAVLDRLSGLTTPQQTAIAAFVDSQASAEGGSGNWELIKEMFFFGALGAANAPIGWKAITGTNNGATYTADGYSFNGTSDYFDTLYNPSVDTGLFTLEDALAGVYCKTNNSTGNKTLSGAGPEQTYLRQTGTQLQYPVNITTTQPNRPEESSFAADSLYVATRAGGDWTLYKNAVAFPMQTGATEGLTNANFTVGARRTPVPSIVDHWDGTLTAAIYGAAVGFNHSNFYSNFQTLLTALGIT